MVSKSIEIHEGKCSGQEGPGELGRKGGFGLESSSSSSSNNREGKSSPIEIHLSSG